ncbi:mitochondrial fission factor-like, partial [Brachyistius frenatus]|uniref:mitochondrial fission factor-like n=1 Tax=Brachyistius frenatus TaxID=100188 RepID=UPI0037E91E96
SSMRRSYSDQSFGRTPPGTPTHKQALVPSRHPSSFRGSGPPLHQCAAPPPPLPVLTSDPEAQRPPLGLLSPQFLLQTARQLGLQASQRLLQTVSHKYRFNNQEKPSAMRGPTQVPAAALVESSRTRVVDSWSPEDEGGAAVEFIILRRQVMKMSRRLAALEKQSCDQRNTEALLFSLLFSTCLLNMWLWIRR